MRCSQGEGAGVLEHAQPGGGLQQKFTDEQDEKYTRKQAKGPHLEALPLGGEVGPLPELVGQALGVRHHGEVAAVGGDERRDTLPRQNALVSQCSNAMYKT